MAEVRLLAHELRENFEQGGRTLDTLGLGNLGKAELQTLLRKGF